MSHLATKISTLFSGQLVGQDEFGNKYDQARRAPKSGRRKRWVMYKGVVEPSKVPAQWHCWLHYTTDKAPSDAQSVTVHKWQREHKPNLTGTAGRYLPDGHLNAKAQRASTTADYVAWAPEE